MLIKVPSREQLKRFLPDHEAIVQFERLFGTATSLEVLVNNIIAGAGLESDGTYSPDLTANYISTASSLYIADILLDLSLYYLQLEVNNVEAGAGLNMDGTYTADPISHYINSATSLKNADSLIDTKLYDVIQRIVTITTNYTALVGNYSIMADATTGNITVTLPLASTATAFTVGITKKDTTANTVTIQRSGANLIAGDISQVLLFDKEVFNFISDGTDWQLAN